MTDINISITGIDETEFKLEKIKLVLSDLQPELDHIGQYLMEFFQNDVFESEGAVYGQRWEGLSDAYQLLKAKKYPGRGVLQATGRMRYSFELFTTTDHAILKNTAPYATYHETGTRKMPQRAFMVVDEQRATEVGQQFVNHLIGRLQGI